MTHGENLVCSACDTYRLLIVDEDCSQKSARTVSSLVFISALQLKLTFLSRVYLSIGGQKGDAVIL